MKQPTTASPAVEVEALPLERYFRAANYLSAAQIYLQDNVLLRHPLEPEHLKARLLGHWGTCPGINLVWAQLNRIVGRERRRVLPVVGPGHGAPAVLANQYLDGTLAEFHPELTRDQEGMARFVRAFSWPGGFPSHVHPGTPGAIHEGGELGYALGVSFGAVFDDPSLVAACIVGDGEAETGATATAWHAPKFLDPVESGAVLPILHLNGYKISNPTVFGAMSDEELMSLFYGYGWEPRVIVAPGLMEAATEGFDWAFTAIDTIQRRARERVPRIDPRPRWPLLILRSPKGWTGIEEVDGHPVEGSFHAHQVPVDEVRADAGHRARLESWLRSYRPQELFDDVGAPAPDLIEFCPTGTLRLGCCPAGYGGARRRALDLPALDALGVEPEPAAGRGGREVSPVECAGRYLAEVVRRNPDRFRIFCPDELMSNKLGAVFDAPTHRNFQWPVEGGGRTEHIGRRGGRVLEVLSEHLCQAWLQGYLLTGRHGLFPSYESFLPIVTSMMDQFAKFLKMSGEIPWRRPVPSLNYLETSTLWRQEHNGFSHQSPGFINSLLNKKGDIMRVYLPPDANCLLSTIDHCLAGVDHVNLVIANKNPMPVWLTMAEAVDHCRAGASIWPWAGTEPAAGEGGDPDVVFVGIGDVVTLEVIAAVDILRRELPELSARVVNVTDLLILERETAHPHGLDDTLFTALFSAGAPIIINFHGYPSAIKQLLFGRGVEGRCHINGYCEEGDTTTPFDMLVRNGASRYDLVVQAIRAAAPHNPRVAARAVDLSLRYEYRLREFRREIAATGTDPEEIRNWSWERPAA